MKRLPFLLLLFVHSTSGLFAFNGDSLKLAKTVNAEATTFSNAKNVSKAFNANNSLLSLRNKQKENVPSIFIGINFITLPFKTKYLFIESEIKLASKISLASRLSYARLYNERTDPYNNFIKEINRGTGIGSTVRFYFNNEERIKGFFMGVGIEVMFGSWENFYNRSDTHYDYGKYTAIAPHIDGGYKFILGKQKRFYLDPMLALGFYVSSSTNDRNNEKLSDVGFFGFPGLTFGTIIK